MYCIAAIGVMFVIISSFMVSFVVYNILEAVEQSGTSSINLDASEELHLVSEELDRIKDEARSSQQNIKLTDIEKL